MTTAAAPAAPWPLTGRHEELDLVIGALEDGATAVFLLGEPGTGKTRLAREALRRLAADGLPTAGATATASGRDAPLAALAHLVPPGALDDPPLLVGATREALAERTGGRPLVLHVDDAHHLDPSSAALLVSLVEARSVQLVATVRPGARVPDALTALRAADGATTLVLGPLDEVAIDTLLHRVLGGPLDGAAEAELLRTSGGNPLFLRELVTGALADGSLREVGGVWRHEGSFGASRELGDRVLGRVAELPDPARSALELIAVGEPIGLDLLESLVDIDLLEDLEARGMVRVEVDQRRTEVRLAHPVYGELIRSSLGRLRLRRLSRLHAESLLAAGARRRGDAARIARWQIDAGMAPDPEVVLAGARLARHHHDWASVVILARAAVDAGHPGAAVMVAEAHFELGEFDEVDAVVAASLAAPDGLDEAAWVHLHRMRGLSQMWGHDDAAGALATWEEAATRVTDPELADQLTFARASLLAWNARLDEAIALAEPLLGSPDARVAVHAALVLELVTAVAGPTSRAIELSDEWFGVHLGLPERLGTNNPGNHLLTKSIALTHAGRYDEASALAELGYGASVANRSLIGQMWFALEHGRIAMARGDAAGARRWFREQVALCRGTGHRRPITLGLCGLAIAEAHLGDAEASAAAIAELDAAPTAILPSFEAEAARARAWERVAAGDPEAARSILRDAAAAADRIGLTLLAALVRVDALRLGDRDVAGPLAEAAPVVGSRVVELAARWAAAPNDDAELGAVADELEALGALMLAAEAAAAAAAAARRAGGARRATAHEQHADELARRCRGAATPALTVTETVVPLTSREREIAVLVADGLSTKEVAERLFLSARTVSNHLQSAYTKLGISKRTELAGALVRLGTTEDER